MTAPEDQNGLREALARDYVLVKRGLYYRPDSMGYTGVLDDAGRYTAEEAKFHNDHCDGVKGILASEAPRFSQACWPEIVTRTLTNDLRAAEAEITRLKEGMEVRDPRVIAAAWKAWHARHGGKLGPGPAFVEAIHAGLACLATLSPKEQPHG